MDMSFKMMFLWELSLEVMLCNRTCIMGGHVLWVDMSHLIERSVILEDLSQLIGYN